MGARLGARWAGTAGLTALLLGFGACGQPVPSGPGSTAPTPPPSPAGSPSVSAAPTTASPAPTREGTVAAAACADLAARLSPAERVGQLLMVAVSSTSVTAEQAAAVAATRAGSVLLLGNSTAGRAVTRRVVGDVRAAADQPGRVEVLLAVDQEGGQVQRLRGEGFDDIPAAVEQARLPDAELRRQAAGWGRQLRRAGIDADLAPVADVVAAGDVGVNEPVGQLRRGYGPSPRVVAAKVRAFTAGMQSAGVATAVKHFPGLGRVRGNTDTTSGVVDRVTTRDDPALRGFRAAVDADVDMVMVSSATYARIDARRRATFSRVVLEDMLRGDLGFRGVAISDDLAATALRDVPAGDRVVRFVAAGGDLAIVGDPAEARTMADALADRARRDPDLATRVQQSATRVLAMKQRRGLADC